MAANVGMFGADHHGPLPIVAYLCGMESQVHSVISGVLALMFVAFAVVQYNDPDPWTWVAIYGLMVGLLIANIFRRLPGGVSLLPMVAALVGCYFLWPDQYIGLTGKMDSRPAVELARESLGLLICALACLYVGVRSWMRRPKRPWERS